MQHNRRTRLFVHPGLHWCIIWKFIGPIVLLEDVKQLCGTVMQQYRIFLSSIMYVQIEENFSDTSM